MSPPIFDTTTEAENRSHWQTLRSLSKHLWPTGRADLRVRVLIAMAALGVAKSIGVVVPLFYKATVDFFSGDPISTADQGDANVIQSLLGWLAPQSLPDISPGVAAVIVPVGLIVGYGVARVSATLFGELRDFVFAKVSQHSQRRVALDTFRHLHTLSLRFHLDRQTGGLSRVIERGTRGIQFLLSFMLFNIVPTILEILLVTGILLVAFDWRFAAVTFGTISIYITFTLVMTDWRLKYRKRMNKRDAEANTKAIDSLLNYETVKYFGNEEHEYRRFDTALEDYERAAVDSQASLSALNIGQGTIIGGGLVWVMLMAGEGVANGTMTIGDFVLVNTYLIQLYLPLNFLGFVYREIKQSLVDMDKMFELLEQNIEIQDQDDARPISMGAADIEFKNVSFGYSEERQILDGISFRVPAGNTVAVVGPSGAGKSTISRLLFRFYDVTSGSIEIDGQPITDIQQSSLRGNIGIVPQDTVLFNDTVMYNIRYGRIEASDDEVIEAAKTAQIHDFVLRFEKGYDTIVGERGLKLSGGEKQRVAIARAVLKQPKILIFDEATSALDSQTEREIQTHLNAVSKDRTTLVIAHRLSTIVDADEIIVLKDCKIAERGKHTELLALDGEYATMWARQQEGDGEEGPKATEQ